MSGSHRASRGRREGSEVDPPQNRSRPHEEPPASREDRPPPRRWVPVVRRSLRTAQAAIGAIAALQVQTRGAPTMWVLIVGGLIAVAISALPRNRYRRR
jgi:hypothetical protein